MQSSFLSASKAFGFVSVLSLGLALIRPGFAFAGETPLAVTPDRLTISYAAEDGTWSFPCRSALSVPNDPYDFTITCSEGSRDVRVLDLHVAISKYASPKDTSVRYELLTWVNHVGSTTWFEFDGAAQLKSVSSRVAVPGEVSVLDIKIAL